MWLKSEGCDVLSKEVLCRGFELEVGFAEVLIAWAVAQSNDPNHIPMCVKGCQRAGIQGLLLLKAAALSVPIENLTNYVSSKPRNFDIASQNVLACILLHFHKPLVFQMRAELLAA